VVLRALTEAECEPTRWHLERSQTIPAKEKNLKNGGVWCSERRPSKNVSHDPETLTRLHPPRLLKEIRRFPNLPVVYVCNHR
jgi:hypothetical protein